MAGGVKRNRGNKKLGAWDRLSIPDSTYVAPTPYPITPTEQPTSPVGQRVCVKNVIIYEISPTYEGNPMHPSGVMTKIPIELIVGCPVTKDSLTKGFDLKTMEGETINIHWYSPFNYAGGSDQFNAVQGIGMYVKEVPNRDPFYETEWGHIFGVGIEWVAGDGSMSGVNWANRFVGFSYNVGTLDSNTGYPSWSINTGAPDTNPAAIRGGLMLGNPNQRTIKEMGYALPLRIFPALGKQGSGSLFGFNRNVSDFIQIAPPNIPFVTLSGEGNVEYGDWVGFNWKKDDYAKKVRLNVKMTQGTCNISWPTDAVDDGNGGKWFGPSSTRSTGSDAWTVWYTTGQLYEYEAILWEVDDSDKPVRKIAGVTRTEDWTTVEGHGSNSKTVAMDIPLHPDPCGCGDSGTTTTSGGTGNTGGTTPTPTSSGIKYFCDNSLQASSIDTTFWTGRRDCSAFGVPTTFWEGKNQWMTLFGSPYNKSIIPNIVDFHKFLFKFSQAVYSGTITIPQTSWTDFKSWADTNLSCLTDLQKGSIYATWVIKKLCYMYSPATGFLSGDILDKMGQLVALTKTFTYDWIDFNDVMADENGSITGAFAADAPSVPQFNSYINFEPQLLQYPMSAALAHRPYDYIIPAGQQWGQSGTLYTDYYLPTFDENDYQPYVGAEVAIHEIGHATAYYGKDFYGTTLHEMQEWLDIAKWNGINDSHMPKTQPGQLNDRGGEAAVSDYGNFNPAEDFAEAHRMYIINPRFLMDKFPKRYAFMKKYVDGMHQLT
jgi:hypothetical protein